MKRLTILVLVMSLFVVGCSKDNKDSFTMHIWETYTVEVNYDYPLEQLVLEGNYINVTKNSFSDERFKITTENFPLEEHKGTVALEISIVWFEDFPEFSEVIDWRGDFSHSCSSFVEEVVAPQLNTYGFRPATVRELLTLARDYAAVPEGHYISTFDFSEEKLMTVNGNPTYTAGIAVLDGDPVGLPRGERQILTIPSCPYDNFYPNVYAVVTIDNKSS